jgi:hypothetical protein
MKVASARSESSVVESSAILFEKDAGWLNEKRCKVKVVANPVLEIAPSAKAKKEFTVYNRDINKYRLLVRVLCYVEYSIPICTFRSPGSRVMTTLELREVRDYKPGLPAKVEDSDL